MTQPEQSDERVLDRIAFRENIGENRELARRLVTLFFAELDERLNAIRSAIAQQDLKTLENLAHSVKGSLGIFGAQVAYEGAYRLECAARHRQLGDLNHLCAALEQELLRLRPCLQAVIDTDSAPSPCPTRD